MVATFQLAGSCLAQERAPANETPGTFPTQLIAKSESAHEWPFTVDEGELSCVRYAGQRHVFFSELLPADADAGFGNMKLPRTVAVSTNPLALLVNVEDRDLIAPFDDLEQLIIRMAPFEAMGRQLCDEEPAGRGD